jgi:hypothetical protein
MSVPEGRAPAVDRLKALIGPVTVPSPSWRHPDSRHFALLLLGAAASTGGPLAAGASTVTVLAFAAAGLLLIGLPGFFILQPWRDPKWGPWVGGAMLFGVSVVALTVTELIRPR